jgi:hypothetical protein
MTNLTNIATELEALIPSIKEDFKNYFRKQIVRFADQAKADPVAFQKMARDCYANSSWRNARPFAEMDSNRITALPTGAVKEEWLEKNAAEYAEGQVAGFVAKLTKKIGDLENVHIGHLNHASFEFSINGMMQSGAVVRINQQAVFKISPKGNPFVQWPARIYVNGDFTPEAAFKKMA